MRTRSCVAQQVVGVLAKGGQVAYVVCSVLESHCIWEEALCQSSLHTLHIALARRHWQPMPPVQRQMQSMSSDFCRPRLARQQRVHMQVRGRALHPCRAAISSIMAIQLPQQQMPARFKLGLEWILSATFIGNIAKQLTPEVAAQLGADVLCAQQCPVIQEICMRPLLGSRASFQPALPHVEVCNEVALCHGKPGQRHQ